MRDTISVVMPVHAGVNPEHFRRALESLAQQTHLPDQIIVVIDGPVPVAVEQVVATYVRRPGNFLIERLPSNSGPGVANNRGLQLATSRWVAKADADDVNMVHRLQMQAEFVARTAADVVGSAMLEFEDEEWNFTRLRRMPAAHGRISARMPLNNPINHPTSFYRRDLAVQVGGYSRLRFAEDYDLFARMMRAGAIFANLPEPLVAFRMDSDAYRRRSFRTIWQSERTLQTNLLKYQITTRRSWVRNMSVRLAFALLPSVLLKRAHQRVFTSPVSCMLADEWRKKLPT